MRTVIAGGHGQIAMRLERLIAAAGDEAVGLIRDPGQVADLEAIGAGAAVCDLEQSSLAELAGILEGADAVVFAAGAGPGSGAARKTTVDRNAAILLADAAQQAGVRRYLMVSGMGADHEPPAGTDPVFAAYLRAKSEADANLRSRSGLDWTVLRPGRLTDRPGSGRVLLAEKAERGEIPRDDVAAVLLGLLRTPGTAGLTLDLVAGETPVDDAVAAASGRTA